MNRRSLFKRLIALIGAICAAPFVAKSRPAKYVECSGPRNAGKTSFAWDATQAIVPYRTVDSLAAAICCAPNMKILVVSPEAGDIFNESWQLLCEHEKIKVSRSEVRVNALTKQIYFKLENGTKVMLFRAYPNCDFERQIFGRDLTMICTLVKDMPLLDEHIPGARWWWTGADLF